MNYLLIHNNQDIRLKTLIDYIERITNQTFDDISDIKKTPDIHFIDNGAETIKIEDIHKLQLSLRFKPMQSKFQIGIICNAQNLTTISQNALLKTLEDASQNTHFILTVDNEKNLLQTIRSRMQQIFIDDLSDSNIDVDIARDFVNKNFFDKMQFVEIVAQSSQKEVLQFLNALLKFYHTQNIELAKTNIRKLKTNLNHEKFIIKTYGLIKTTNVNIKGTLWNMVIQLYL